MCLIPGRTQAFIIWILKIRAQLANHSLKHNHVIYYLNHWLSKRNICLITLFCFFIPFSTLYLFKNDSSFSRFVYLIDLPAASTMQNLENSKNVHTLITIESRRQLPCWGRMLVYTDRVIGQITKSSIKVFKFRSFKLIYISIDWKIHLLSLDIFFIAQTKQIASLFFEIWQSGADLNFLTRLLTVCS